MSEYIYNYKKQDSDEIILKYLDKINLEDNKRSSDFKKSSKAYFYYFKIIKNKEILSLAIFK